MILLGLLAIPFVVGGAAYLLSDATISWKEYAAMVAVSMLIAFGGYQLAKYGAMADVEHWNGHITAKNDGTVSCCHCHQECSSYDEDGNCESWEEVCSHNHDYYWLLDISTGDTIGEQCTPQSPAPEWYEDAYVGEPAAVAHTYTNYLKADPHSLMTPGLEEHLDAVPVLPEIYGMYHVKRVIQHGVATPHGWQDELDKMNDRLGATYQVDILVLLTDRSDPQFAKAVEAKWLYGPKNALTIVLGAPDGKTIEWSRVVSLSDVNELKINIRDELPGKTLADPAILPFIENEVKVHFTRTPMEEYAYLATAARPTKGTTIFLYIFNFIIVIGMAYYAHHNDVFGDERYLRRRR